MKTEELTALGVTEEAAKQILAINGKDIENAKKKIADEKDTAISNLTIERDGLKGQLTAAQDTLKKFEGIDPEKIQKELQDYKTKAEDAEKKFTREITARDQKDWITKKLDEYGVKSPLARKQITAEVMSETDGLKWQPGKDGKPAAFFGFDDYMKAAKEEDSSLYQTAEEKEAAEKDAATKGKAPEFTGPLGEKSGGADKKFVPPKIF
ncbi:MAG: phage scaffolding protein [Clostridia bacterium]|nr:phage scaffolding protein [Clostridia bacterium]